jgi:dephospho-CoA kinase
MLKVGITGGIGCGKTLVCEIFKAFGLAVYNADQRAKHLTDTNRQITEKLKEIFGPDIYLASGLDRKRVGKMAFSDPYLLNQMNNIIHPVVFSDYKKWLEAFFNEKYTLIESAILFESGLNQMLDFVIAINAPAEIRIGRIMKRDGLSESEAMKRIGSQMFDDERNKKSQFIINNDGNTLLLPQVIEIHQQLIK